MAPWLLLLALCLAWNGAKLINTHLKQDHAWLGGWDNNFYLAWGRSLVVDGDWDFANDLAFAGSLAKPRDAAAFQRHVLEVERTATGRVQNKYASGTGLLSVPWLLLARLVLALAFAVGLTGPPDPFSGLYAFAFVASGVLWGFAGLVGAAALLRREYSGGVATVAVLAGATGLSLGYYVWFEPTMAHATGFGVATLFVASLYGWADRLRDGRGDGTGWRLRAFLMGVTLGIACLVRFTNVALALAPIVVGLALRSPDHVRDRRFISVMAQSGALAAAGMLLGFVPQLIAWKLVYGAFVVDSYVGETLAAWPRHLALVLFGPRNGLFSWTPTALVAVAGLVLSACHSATARAGLAVLAATAWTYGGWSTYWLGDSFGMRGFVDVSFFLLFGLAEVLRRLQGASVVVRRAGRACLVVCSLWALHLVVCYRADIQPHGQPLALRAVLTEWEQWRDQVGKDTGLRR